MNFVQLPSTHWTHLTVRAQNQLTASCLRACSTGPDQGDARQMFVLSSRSAEGGRTGENGEASQLASDDRRVAATQH
jgi:hypothetical protein